MNIPTLQQLLEAGVHFGHKVSRGNPRMGRFLYGSREGVHIIDLLQSEKGLKEAYEYVRELGKNSGVLLFVGTKKQSKEIVKELAKKVEAPYLVERWIGGFLTNFEEISKNVKKLKDLKEAKEKGELSKYTKKEQLLITRTVTKLERDLGGVLDLDKLPDALFIVDAQRDFGAVKEASRVGVKVVAITDSNADPTLIDYPIPGNDDAIKSITILVETIVKAYGEGKKEAGKIAEKAEAKRVKDEKAREEKIAAEVAIDVAAAEEKIEKETVEESERKTA